MGLRQRLWGDVSASPTGPRNLITDVPGVAVGHCDIRGEGLYTGVTAVLPCADNPFLHKLPAAAHVINGFGKSCGLVQIAELGTLESPILLTNTLSVPMAGHALVEHMLVQNPDIGDKTGTVNTVVMECNDGGISDIRALSVQPGHVRAALEAAGPDFEEGAVGAGSGMTCYGLKGGIGSASRVLDLAGGRYTLGCLVLTNFGFLGDLTFCGVHLGERLAARSREAEQGSIILLLATDLPLSDRQLGRLCRRASMGIARTGAFTGNGSGEIALAFSTANRIPHYDDGGLQRAAHLPDSRLDPVFRAVVSSVEESILSSLCHAETVVGRSGKPTRCLREALRELRPDPQLEALREAFAL
ncbi:MAG: P1 family peptidase [Clostridiales bacterium]|nr:P1 family peptidase [Clostridiales bacterium]